MNSTEALRLHPEETPSRLVGAIRQHAPVDSVAQTLWTPSVPIGATVVGVLSTAIS